MSSFGVTLKRNVIFAGFRLFLLLLSIIILAEFSLFSENNYKCNVLALSIVGEYSFDAKLIWLCMMDRNSTPLHHYNSLICIG